VIAVVCKFSGAPSAVVKHPRNRTSIPAAVLDDDRLRTGSMSLSSTRAGLSSAILGGPSTPVVSVPLRLPAYDDRRAKGLRDAYLPRVLRKPPGEPRFCSRPPRRCITNFGRHSTEFLPLYSLGT
jgi:hypothetical protein